MSEFPVLIDHMLGRILAWSLGFWECGLHLIFTNLCMLLFILVLA